MGGRGGGGGGGGGGVKRGGKGKGNTKSMIRAYKSGKSLSQVAASHGVSTSTVHSRLTQAGVQLRARGGQPRG